MTYFLTILVAGIIFSVLNRIRGSEILHQYYLPSIAKNLCGLFCGALIYYATGLWWTVIVALLLYRLGESFGWGEWMLAILRRMPMDREVTGKINIFGFIIWDGIHHIANFLIPEKKDYLNYSRLALFIRGFYTWIPFLVFGYIMGIYSFLNMIYILVPLAFIFVFSFELARFLYLKSMFGVTEYNTWETAEFVYGFGYGILLALLFI